MNDLSGKLNEAETIFYHLLDDDKMFDQQKFLKALQQQKIRRAEEFLSRQPQIKDNKKGGKKGANKLNPTNSALKQKPLTGNPSANQTLIHPGEIPENLGNENAQVQKLQAPIEDDKQKGKAENGQQPTVTREKKKRAKQLDLIDVYGLQFQGAKQVEGYSFFSDLNYGDMALVFENPYYDFQLKERQEIEQFQISFLRWQLG
jgi:hypothetical protein